MMIGWRKVALFGCFFVIVETKEGAHRSDSIAVR